MKIASVAEVKSQFSAFLKASAGGPVVVTRNGRPVAVIVGVEDEDEIERLLMAYSPHLRAILAHPVFRAGLATTTFVERDMAGWRPASAFPGDAVLIMAAVSELLPGVAAAGRGVRAEGEEDDGDLFSPWNRSDQFRPGRSAT